MLSASSLEGASIHLGLGAQDYLAGAQAALCPVAKGPQYSYRPSPPPHHSLVTSRRRECGTPSLCLLSALSGRPQACPQQGVPAGVLVGGVSSPGLQ